MDAKNSASELAGTPSASTSQLTDRTASTSEDKAARRTARDAKRERQRRAADPTLRESEAASTRRLYGERA